jgi:hypothetical protein
VKQDADGFGEMLFHRLEGETLSEIARAVEDAGPFYSAALEKERSRSSTSQSSTGRIAR